MNKLKLSALGLLAVLSIGLPSLACKGGCKKGGDGEKKAFRHGGGGKHFISMADTNSEIQNQFKNHWKKKDI